MRHDGRLPFIELDTELLVPWITAADRKLVDIVIQKSKFTVKPI
jgi:hypothetical protein